MNVPLRNPNIISIILYNFAGKFYNFKINFFSFSVNFPDGNPISNFLQYKDKCCPNSHIYIHLYTFRPQNRSSVITRTEANPILFPWWSKQSKNKYTFEHSLLLCFSTYKYSKTVEVRTQQFNNFYFY